MSETKENENMSLEQIDQIAALLGQRREAAYCTMDAFATNLMKMLMFLVGQSYESRTLNYNCVKMVLEHIPATNFDYIKKMVLSFNQEKKKLKDSNNLVEKYRNKCGELESRVSLADYWQQQAIFNQTLLMEQTESGFKTNEIIRNLKQ